RCGHASGVAAGARGRRRARRGAPRGRAPRRLVPRGTLRPRRLAYSDRASGAASDPAKRRPALLRRAVGRGRPHLARLAAPGRAALGAASRPALAAALPVRPPRPVLVRAGAVRGLACAGAVRVATVGRRDAVGGTAAALGGPAELAATRRRRGVHHARSG